MIIQLQRKLDPEPDVMLHVVLTFLVNHRLSSVIGATDLAPLVQVVG